MNLKYRRSGFSLVELMVVVAIIGILATIAVPNFTKFQAKAKQTSAKVELVGIYTAEKAFFTEFSSYHTNLAYIGFVPDGFPINTGGCPTTGTNKRYYITGFAFDGSDPGTRAADRPTGAPAIPAACSAFGTLGVNFYPATVLRADGTALTVEDGGVYAAWQLRARAYGNISGRSSRDVWEITEDKNLTNATSGI